MNSRNEKSNNPGAGASPEDKIDNENQISVEDLKWALEGFDRTLNGNNVKMPKDKIISCLMGRIDCASQLHRHEIVTADAKRVLKMLAEIKDTTTSQCVVRWRLLHALCMTRKFYQAIDLLREWQIWLGALSEVKPILDRYVTILEKHQSNPDKLALVDPAAKILNDKLANWIRLKLPPDRFTEKVLNNSVSHRSIPQSQASTSPTSSTSSSVNLNMKLRNQGKGDKDSQKEMVSYGGNKLTKTDTDSTSSQGNCNPLKKIHRTTSEASQSPSHVIHCSYCAITFGDRNELKNHCQTESHQIVIMSDQGRDWKCRPPPRGLEMEDYILCESFLETGVCHYGVQCIDAHGPEELTEWKTRFDYRRMRLERAREKELYGKSYTEILLDKWASSPSPEKIMCEKVDDIEDTCPSDLVTTIASKVSKREWGFTLKTSRSLRAVALLQDGHRNHFTLKQVIPDDRHDQGMVDTNITYDQEWMANCQDNEKAGSQTLEHRVLVEFSTDIYGTFRQSIVFDVGTEPVLVKHLCVDVVPVSDIEKINEIKRDIVLSTAKRWDESNSNIVPFESAMTQSKWDSADLDAQYETSLMEKYPCPRPDTFTLTQSTIMDKRLTKNNYSCRMHELLYVEEMARYEHVARFNLTTRLTLTSNYMLTSPGVATKTTKYANGGELYALLQLGKDISEDTSAGRLILNNCSKVNLSLTIPKEEIGGEHDHKRKVYEAHIEDKGKNSIYLLLSAQTVSDLKLTPDKLASFDIQFQLNRLNFCEWHRAIDKIIDYRLIFPDTLLPPSIPWTPKKQWSDALDSKLNTKQREAVLAITTPVAVPLPPILLIGPFGTGKTFTLAQAIKQLLTQKDTRILICTHSNSAADLYIKEYLHPWVEEGHEAARPLRVYYHKRWVATAHHIVQKYCLIEVGENARRFLRPTIEDVTRHRIVVVTLSISMELASLNLPKGFFTHILLDEAAQAMECEAIMPLALANEKTKIVLAGDHMQMSPELFSEFAKDRKMHLSLLERLYDHYPPDFPCKILLCENYRAHEAIIKFTSELFYDQKLVASGKQPRHGKFYPLTFFTTRGEEVQECNSTTFYNNSEVYELVERVVELRKKWPPAWGKINESSIGIMTPYADQVFRIRSELRKRGMDGVSVERVLNVQGKQFRAVFLSTVRTRRTCSNKTQQREVDFGFLSNSKLLNTAITRAQSLVAVVGDPVALCSVGRCRKVWEQFIKVCCDNKSLFGITWTMLRAQLDGVELKKVFVLNPLAPEFVPRGEAYLRNWESMAYYKNQQMMSYPYQHVYNPMQNHMMSLCNNCGTNNTSGNYGSGPLNQYNHPPFNTLHQHTQPPHVSQQFMNPHGTHVNAYPPKSLPGPLQPPMIPGNMPHNLYPHSQLGAPLFYPPNLPNTTQPQQMHPSVGHPLGVRPPFGASSGLNVNVPLLNSGNSGSSYLNSSQSHPPVQQPQPLNNANVYYPHQQQPPMNSQSNQPIRSGLHPPTQQGPTIAQPQQLAAQSAGPSNNSNIWGTIPANINPQLTGTNAWQLAKTSGPFMNPQHRNNAPSHTQPPNMPPINFSQPSSARQLVPSTPTLRSPCTPTAASSVGSGGLGPALNTHSFMMPSYMQPPQTLKMTPNIPALPLSHQQGGNPIMTGQSMSPTANELLRHSELQRLNSQSVLPFPGVEAQQQAALSRSSTLSGSGDNNGTNFLDRSSSHYIGPQQQQQQPMHQLKAPMANVPLMGNMAGMHGIDDSGWAVLLPPNMALFELFNEPKEFQLKWLCRLVETQGFEAAQKLSDILRQMQLAAAHHNGQLNVTGVGFANNSGGMLMNGMNKSGPGDGESNSNGLVGLNNQVDVVFDSLMNGSSMTQPILRDLFGAPATATGSSSGTVVFGPATSDLMAFQQAALHRQPTQYPVKELNSLNLDPAISHDPNLGKTGIQNSVPLYRRQAGQALTTAESSASNAFGSHSFNKFLDSVMNSNTGGDLSGLLNDCALLLGNSGGVGSGDGLMQSTPSPFNNGGATYASVLSTTGMDAVGGGVGESGRRGVDKNSRPFENMSLMQTLSDAEKKTHYRDSRTSHGNGFYNFYQ